MKKQMRLKRLAALMGAALLLGSPSLCAATYNFAVWLDGSLSDGGNAIPGRLDAAFGAGAATLVTTAQVATPGFLAAYDALVVSRYDASFGTYALTGSAAAKANIQAYVGLAGSVGQGGVALFTNDAADNLAGSGSGDPFDANLDALFVNAAKFAASTGHGYIGEFNGAVMGMSQAGGLGLLTGSASATYHYGPDFTYLVGAVGAGNPIDLGVTFPFTDLDHTTFRTDVTGYLASNEVDIYADNHLPAVLANEIVIHGGSVPELSSTLSLFGAAVGGLALLRRRVQA